MKDQQSSTDETQNKNGESKEGAKNDFSGLDQILEEGRLADKIMNSAKGSTLNTNTSGALFDVYGYGKVVGDKAPESGPSRLKLSKALELNPAMIAILSRWGYFEFVNSKFCDISGYELKDLENQQAAILHKKQESEDIHDFEHALQKGLHWKGEFMQVTKSGETFIFSGSLTPLEDKYGFINGFILSGQDVTPFRKTEQKLQQALEEKNMLFAELHHRVKNNLAIVSGLMQLQAFNEENKTLQNRLLSSAGRVQSMASMHEALYESQNLNNIEFSSIVKRIAESVGGLYGEQTDMVDISYNLESVSLNINQAHPLSLILHEVISNIYRHAFEFEEGNIWIKLNQKGSDVYLSIKDNGVGLSRTYETIGEEKKTTGYELLNLLADQLDGDYRYTSGEKGTHFDLHFKVREANGASAANLYSQP